MYREDSFKELFLKKQKSLVESHRMEDVSSEGAHGQNETVALWKSLTVSPE